MTSTTIETILPPNSIDKVVVIPWGWNICPSNYFNHVVEVSIFGESSAFQHDIHIMQVKDPSSIIGKNMFFPIILTLIWK
jgi:hypothetical protein